MNSMSNTMCNSTSPNKNTLIIIPSPILDKEAKAEDVK